MTLDAPVRATTKEKSKLPEKFIYLFSADRTDGNSKMKDVLGGKGANLAEMTSLGLPVPPGFTISTDVCSYFYNEGERLTEPLKAQVLEALKKIESLIGKKFGDPANPLLVSVRSGARASMPGMMDTILNLGLNEKTVDGLAKQSGNERFAWDSYRRFIQMYANVVLKVNTSLLEVTLEDLKHAKGFKGDSDLSAEDFKFLVKKYKAQIAEQIGQRFPEEPIEQLWGSIGAVFKSWNTPRAITYRELNGIPASWGTAVNIQSMVFGNLSDDSATGVAFTRNPSTGEKKFFGEYLLNAQGEDVVAGLRTPGPIAELKSELPKCYDELVGIAQKLERHYKDMQDIEFTIEKGRLWMLQTRNGKRTAQAALQVACDMVKEGLISQDEALLRIEAKTLDQLLHPMLDPNAKKILLSKGLPASPGGAVGQLVFSSEDAVKWRDKGLKTILARIETSPEDIEGMVAAQGILTTRGGMTSHAAVVARGMGKCCIAGAGEIEIDYQAKTIHAAGYVIKEGELITLDGSTGEVILGEIKMVEPKLDQNFHQIMQWADSARRLKVRTNADTPKDAKVARGFGAEGIGLCRTEHMFFDSERIDIMRAMILAETKEDRLAALNQLLPFQREDFVGIFREMQGLPVTIRLLDPPLHEFLPHSSEEVAELAKKLHLDYEVLKRKVESLHEFNPMLGHRGCRLAITYPEIYQMQARAIAEAACKLVKDGVAIEPEVMIPLIFHEEELLRLKELVQITFQEVMQKSKQAFKYLIGTMIELPRAALVADKIAQHAEFFSFGTNDLTQTTLGLSRDDSSRFLPSYISSGVIHQDPFVSIDELGVGELVKKAVELGQKTRPDIKLGICGEHGGDPQSIYFFERAGLNYVSCSPFRVPIARLAAAQAVLRLKTK